MVEDLPDYQSLMAPVLHQLRGGEPRTVLELTRTLAPQFQLTDDQLAVMLPSGKTSVWRSRVRWAVAYLYQAKAVERTARGIYQITARGRQLLDAHPNHITNSELRAYEEFRDFLSRSRPVDGRVVTQEAPRADTERSTPNDRIAAAVGDAHAAVAHELLDRVMSQPPYFLERLVLELLAAMGYTGAKGTADHVGRSGDEGIDGVVNQDALGLDRIYVQAKRYALDRSVGRPDVQAFVGALHGQQADRGIFITTAHFTREALEYSQRVAQRIVLVDGPRLAQLMIDHGVGTQVEQSFALVRVDEDFFD